MDYLVAVVEVLALATLPSLAYAAYRVAKRPRWTAAEYVPGLDWERELDRLIAGALVRSVGRRKVAGRVCVVERAPYGWRASVDGVEVCYVERPQAARGPLLAALRGGRRPEHVDGPGTHLVRARDGRWIRQRVDVPPPGSVVAYGWDEVDLTSHLYDGPCGVVVLDRVPR